MIIQYTAVSVSSSATVNIYCVCPVFLGMLILLLDIGGLEESENEYLMLGILAPLSRQLTESTDRKAKIETSDLLGIQQIAL